MSRSAYTDDCDDYWAHIRWRGAVASALRGKRGQDFLREMLSALDALETPCLARGSLQTKGGEVCALGSVGRARGIDMADVDPYDYESIANLFGISEALAREIMFVNDEWCALNAPSKRRFTEVRTWILEQIRSRGDLVPMSPPTVTPPL
jgi:hypothetical protein